MLYDPKWEQKPTEIGTVLIAARKLVENAWCKGGYFRGDAVCTVGAIAKAMNLDDVYTDDVREVVSAFAAANGLEKHKVAAWNDSRHRTQKQVLTAFDKAITAERR